MTHFPVLVSQKGNSEQSLKQNEKRSATECYSLHEETQPRPGQRCGFSSSKQQLCSSQYAHVVLCLYTVSFTIFVYPGQFVKQLSTHHEVDEFEAISNHTIFQDIDDYLNKVDAVKEFTFELIAKPS